MLIISTHIYTYMSSIRKACTKIVDLCNENGIKD